MSRLSLDYSHLASQSLYQLCMDPWSEQSWTLPEDGGKGLVPGNSKPIIMPRKEIALALPYQFCSLRFFLCHSLSKSSLIFCWGGIEGWCIYGTLGWMGRTAQLRHTCWNAQDISVQQSGKGLMTFAGALQFRCRETEPLKWLTHYWLLCLWPLCPAVFWTSWPSCNDKVWRMLSWFQSSERHIFLV